MKLLKAVTPHGVFDRRTGTAYTHIIVWDSPRAREGAALIAAGGHTKTGVYGRWHKDGGFAVTWHKSDIAAIKASAGRYVWDRDATVLGIYPVIAD